MNTDNKNLSIVLEHVLGASAILNDDAPGLASNKNQATRCITTGTPPNTFEPILPAPWSKSGCEGECARNSKHNLG